MRPCGSSVPKAKLEREAEVKSCSAAIARIARQLGELYLASSGVGTVPDKPEGDTQAPRSKGRHRIAFFNGLPLRLVQ